MTCRGFRHPSLMRRQSQGHANNRYRHEHLHEIRPHRIVIQQDYHARLRSMTASNARLSILSRVLASWTELFPSTRKNRIGQREQKMSASHRCQHDGFLSQVILRCLHDMSHRGDTQHVGTRSVSNVSWMQTGRSVQNQGLQLLDSSKCRSLGIESPSTITLCRLGRETVHSMNRDDSPGTQTLHHNIHQSVLTLDTPQGCYLMLDVRCHHC